MIKHEPIAPIEMEDSPERASRRRYETFQRPAVSGKLLLLSVIITLFSFATIIGLWIYLALPKSFGQEEAAASIVEPAYPPTAVTDAHRNLLDDDGKMAYDKVEASLRSMSSSCTFEPGLSYEKFQDAFRAVMCDNPDIFWVNSNYIARPSLEGVSAVTFRYFYDDLQEVADKHGEYVDRAEKLAARLEDAPGTDESIDLYSARQAYDCVAATLTYEANAKDQTISPFFEEDNRAVCAGYARSFLLMCDIMGIPCVYIIGSTPYDENLHHAWNACVLDGKIYYVDPTWGDNSDGISMRDTYFTCDEDAFGIEHVAETPELIENLSTS